MLDLNKIAHRNTDHQKTSDNVDNVDSVTAPHVYRSATRAGAHEEEPEYTKPETVMNPANGIIIEPEEGFAEHMETEIPGYIRWASGGPLPESQRRLLEAEGLIDPRNRQN